MLRKKVDDMWWWIGCTAGLALILIALAVSPLTAQLYWRQVGTDEHATFKIKGLYGLFRYREELPVIGLKRWWEGVALKAEHRGAGDADRAELMVPLQSLFQSARGMTNILRTTDGLRERLLRLLRRTSCTEFRWNTYVGTADAAETAVLTGCIWFCKSMLLGALFRLVRLRVRPAVMVNPQYNERRFQTELRIGIGIPLGVLLWHAAGMYVCLRRSKSGRATLKRLMSKGGMAVSPAK
jgi:hypothetical protein